MDGFKRISKIKVKISMCFILSDMIIIIRLKKSGLKNFWPLSNLIIKCNMM